MTHYTIETDKLRSPVRAVLITDLHSCVYGESQRELLEKITVQRPDLVLLAGDIIDDKMPSAGAIALLEGLKGKYDCYYVTGNHELWSGRADGIKALLREHGVTVLDGARVTAEINGQLINIVGVDDPDIGEKAFSRQLESAFKGIDSGLFTILLSHRPERFEVLAGYGFDLMLSGHAHGGQWRLPVVLPGLYAPDQGFFPKYTGGVYEQGGAKMLVSRGLARESTRVPRVFNPPELVVIDIVPIK